MQAWQLQEAKARLSEVIQKAINEGPQDISLRGSPLHGAEFEPELDASLTGETGL